MKKSLIASIASVVFGLLIALGPRLIFKVCAIASGCGDGGIADGCGSGGGCGDVLSNDVLSGDIVSDDVVNNDTASGGCGSGGGGCGSSGSSGGCGDSSINFPTCHYTAQALFGFGFLITALGFCMFVFDDIKTQLGLVIGVFFSSIITLFLIHGLIGGCIGNTMACRAVTIPSVTVISALLLAASAAYALYIILKKTE